MNHLQALNTYFDGTINLTHNYVMTTLKNSDNDVYTYKNMLEQEDRMEFIKAMFEELDDHNDRGHWTIMPRSEMPDGHKPIMAIWSFKRKRYPDGRIKKYKGRLCAHGGQQEYGVNYWETYSPVVNWMSVRLLLTICHLHKFDSQSIDFVLAFPQADLKVDIYMALPQGIEVANGSESYVLKLNKNLYGLKQASHNWFLMLSNGLRDRGFEPSQVDPCVFYKEDMIVLVYVDDVIAVAKDGKMIDNLVDSLREGNEHFKLTSEGKLDEYLGVEIVNSEGDSFEIKQPHLISRLLKAVNINPADTSSRDTPVTTPLLHKDLEGISRKLSLNYCSVI